MNVSDLTVEVRNSSLARVGQILASDLVGLELSLRFNKLGSWKITLRSSHPLADALRAPGAGLIVTGPNGVLISGPTVQATQNKTGDDPTGTWEIIGVDDAVVLGERLAYPVPTTASLAGQTSAYDSRTGVAETVAKAYVNANIGPSAPTARKITGLTVDTDLGRGSTVVVNARFDKLGELIYGILTPSNLGFDIKQVGSGLMFEVFQPVDRSATVRMDVDNLRLTKSEYTYASPGATRVIVAGQGQGSARTLIERTSTASTAAETSWGRRIEVFKDSRNTNDTTELNTAGDEILAVSGFTVEGIKVTPSDDLASMQFGVHWGLGDKVTVVVGNTEVAKVVTEAAIVVTEEGVKVGATVGDPDAAANDTTSTLVAGQTSQEARISNLERNDAVFVQTGNIADQAVTTDKIANATIVDADISPSAAIAVSKLASSAITVNGTATPLGGSVTTWQSHNYLVNGGFDIWQRGTSNLPTATNFSNGYTADRWQLWRAAYAAGAFVGRQPTTLTGFQYAARVQRTSGNTSTAELVFSNHYDTDYCLPLAGKTVTMSFWARAGANFSSASSQLLVRLTTGTGTDERPSSAFTGAAAPLNQVVTLTTSWQRFTVTGTIASTATQWAFQLRYTPVGTAGTNDWFEVAGAQLEEGSVATQWRRNSPNLQAELAACQRYYERRTSGGVANGMVAGGGQAYSSTFGAAIIQYAVPKRANPSISFSAASTFNVWVGAGNTAISNLSTGEVTPQVCRLTFNSTGLVTGQAIVLFASGATEAWVGIDAEL
ncbi:MAG TPA: siphovirus ReqiPepy6 Gp37-like family protein [Sideroxyarcus sp.]|nr:siphovirus ReqiPepy6 Gp37-like family protein [Sideroxyarcus sp.]